MEILLVIIYVLILMFCAGFMYRFLKYRNMPVHLRWELYPLAGETRRPWGGSYLEDPEWWTKDHAGRSLHGELRFMAQEILCFREYFHRNKSLWYIVYPFHLGIFLFVGFFVLLLVGALMLVADVAVAEDSSSLLGQLVFYLTLIAGVGALVLGTTGCLALLIRKQVDRTMRIYTRRIEYVNIILVLAVFLTGLLSWALVDLDFAAMREFAKGFITFDAEITVDGLIISHVVLLSLLLAYLPHTNMMHFFMKHFTYNSVRWDDVPQVRGGEIEQKLQPLLAQPVSWAAPHVKGITRWSDIATSQTAERIRRKEGTRHAKRPDQT